tara:strand:+ start:685 stop:900 length:216 start_codon:yes stop_codon:yes gene_type:complete
MHETAAERERRLRQLGGGESLWLDMDRIFTVYRQISDEMTNPCAEIMIVTPHRCTLGDNPLIKFTKFKFNF